LCGGGDVGFEVGAKLSCGGGTERLGALGFKQRGSEQGLLVASEGVWMRDFWGDGLTGDYRLVEGGVVECGARGLLLMSARLELEWLNASV
jgi:hypothetical protein